MISILYKEHKKEMLKKNVVDGHNPNKINKYDNIGNSARGFNPN